MCLFYLLPPSFLFLSEPPMERKMTFPSRLRNLTLSTLFSFVDFRPPKICANSLGIFTLPPFPGDRETTPHFVRDPVCQFARGLSAFPRLCFPETYLLNPLPSSWSRSWQDVKTNPRPILLGEGRQLFSPSRTTRQTFLFFSSFFIPSSKSALTSVNLYLGGMVFTVSSPPPFFALPPWEPIRAGFTFPIFFPLIPDSSCPGWSVPALDLEAACFSSSLTCLRVALHRPFFRSLDFSS